jgi:hypothetical protein
LGDETEYPLSSPKILKIIYNQKNKNPANHQNQYNPGKDKIRTNKKSAAFIAKLLF